LNIDEDKRMLKRFFFWGIFKNLDIIKRKLNVIPSYFIDGYLEGIKEIKGKICSFENLSNKEFLQLLGKLALIEKDFYILSICGAKDVKKNKLFVCYYYIPIRNREKDLRNFIKLKKRGY
jgi:hypothetical protein